MISTVCFVAGLTVISVVGSSIVNSGLHSQKSTLSPPYWVGTCSGDIYLIQHTRKHMLINYTRWDYNSFRGKQKKEKEFHLEFRWWCVKNCSTKTKKSMITYLKRVSAVFAGPENTNLLLVLWVKNGLIIV